jgi:hypothetical protein
MQQQDLARLAKLWERREFHRMLQIIDQHISNYTEERILLRLLHWKVHVRLATFSQISAVIKEIGRIQFFNRI